MKLKNKNIKRFDIKLYNNKDEAFLTFVFTPSYFNGIYQRIKTELIADKLDKNDVPSEPWFEVIPSKESNDDISFEDRLGEYTDSDGNNYSKKENIPIEINWKASSGVQTLSIVVKDFEEEIYQGVFSVEHVFRSGIEKTFKSLLESERISIEDSPFSYDVSLSKRSRVKTYKISISSSELFPAEAYKGKEVFEVPKLEKNRNKLSFRKKTVPLPIFNKDDIPTKLKGSQEGKTMGRVLLSQEVYHSLIEKLKLSDKDEDGGYLLGRSYRQPNSPEDEDDPDFTWVVEITDVIKAKGAYGNPGLLLFTHDTWSDLKKTIDKDYPDKKLISWFHTHLFKASEFGLSGMDQDLHRNYFKKPWQIALLLNLDLINKTRELRCFQRAEGEDILIESEYEVIDTLA